SRTEVSVNAAFNPGWPPRSRKAASSPNLSVDIHGAHDRVCIHLDVHLKELPAALLWDRACAPAPASRILAALAVHAFEQEDGRDPVGRRARGRRAARSVSVDPCCNAVCAAKILLPRLYGPCRGRRNTGSGTGTSTPNL